MKTKQITISIPAKYKYQITQPWGQIELHTRKPRIHMDDAEVGYWLDTGEYLQFPELVPNCPNWKQSLIEIK